jgi:beta-phosphoglucomutase-like phosphatase (HAD superfamily)
MARQADETRGTALELCATQRSQEPDPVVRAGASGCPRSRGSSGVEPRSCVLIGDSLSDITGAHAADVPVITYANKPLKAGRFEASGIDAVVLSMADIAVGLHGFV